VRADSIFAQIRKITSGKCESIDCRLPGKGYAFGIVRMFIFACDGCYNELIENVAIYKNVIAPADSSYFDTFYEESIYNLVGTRWFVGPDFSHSFDSLLSGESHRLADVATFSEIGKYKNSDADVTMLEGIRVWMNNHPDLEGLRNRVYSYQVLKS
jgi:hypothetical protein